MKYTTIFLFVITTFLWSSCAVIKDGKPTISQGVFGRLLFLQGNQMPSPDKKNTGGKPVIRKVFIYELTKLSDAEGQSPLFKQVKSKLVATVVSNAEGYFQCKLPIGKYSIFTEEEEADTKTKLFFANLFEGNGEITPFEVTADKITRYDVNINYKAYY